MKWWLMVSIALSMMMAWGSNFPALNYFLFDHLPLFNKFRSVSMWLSITSLLAVISAVFGLNEYLRNEDEIAKAKYKNYLLISFGIVGVICLYFWMIGLDDYTSPRDAEMLKGGYPQWLIDSIVEQREALSKSDALRSLTFIALAFGALYFAAKNNKSRIYSIGYYRAMCDRYFAFR